MPTANEYSDILDNEAKAQSYDAIVAADTAQQNKEALRSSVIGALGTNPDQYAQATKLSRSTGIPAPVVARNLPDVQQRTAINEYDTLLDNAPGTAKAMSNPEFAKVAHDDTQSLGLVETLVNSVKRGYQGLRQFGPAIGAATSAGSIRSIDHVEQMLASGAKPGDIKMDDDPLGVAQYTPEQRAALRNELSSNIDTNAASLAVHESAKRAIPQDAVVGQVSAAFGRGDYGGAARAFLSDPVGYISSIAIESTVAQAPTLLAGGVLGKVGMSLAGRALFAGAGSSATDFASSILSNLQAAGVDTTDPVAVQRAVRDPVLMKRVTDEAAAHAAVVGLVDGFSGHVAGSLPIPKAVAGRLASKPIARELAGIAAQAPIQGALGAVGEAGGEIAAGQKLDPLNIFNEFIGEFGGTPAEVLTIGGHEVAARVKAGRQAVRAEQSAAQLVALSKAATASKLKTRDPQAFSEFVKNVAQDSPASDVFVDGKTFENALAQSGVTPEQLTATMPEAVSQMREAVVTGGDIRIPIEDLATHVAGTPLGEALLPHLRVGDPEAMSLSDAQAFQQQDHAQAQAETAQVEQQAAADAAPAINAVHAQILDQLKAVNRYTPTVNEHYAKLLSSFYEATAGRMGVTPEQLAEHYPVRIAAERMNLAPAFDENASLLNQPDAPITPADGVAPTAAGTLDAPGARGSYEPSTRTITLLKNADLSTFIHESGHFFLDSLSILAERVDAPASVKADAQTVLDWFGVKDLATWHAMTLDEQRTHHEQFARGFEAYAFEGESPSLELSSVFSRFRSWLIAVYKHLTALHVEINPEVRGVMGRLLASDTQIATAQAARQHAPLFASAEAAGMSPEDFAAYQRLGSDATAEAVATVDRRSLNDLRWLSNAKSRKLKAIQREAEGKRKAMHDQVEAEVMAEPVNVARTFFKTGETTSPDGEQIKVTEGHKLNSEALAAMYPESSLNRPALDKLKGMTAKDGLDPELAAQAFGFSSTDHLVRSLTDGEDPTAKIEALTDQRMLETYGDIQSRDALERAAESAIHSEARSRMLAREVGQLSAAVGNKPILLRAAREYADKALAQKKVRDIRPSIYSVAAARAGRNAEAAFKQGDTAGAATAKREQLLSHELTRGAQRAQVEIEKAVAYLKKFDSATVRGSIDAAYRDQIDALLERYDLRTSVTGKELARRKSLRQWIDSQQAMGFEPTIDDSLLDDARKTHFKDATLEEVRGLVDAVKNIEHLGRLKTKLLTAKDERDFGVVVDTIASAIEANAKRTLPAKIESNSKVDRAVLAAADFFASHRKFASLVREMDGHQDGGPIWQTLVRTMNEAGDHEAVAREKATLALGELFKSLPTRNKLMQKVFIAEINTSLSREGRLAVALNWGNETSRQRVMGGDNWSPAQVAAIIRTLSTDELHFVQRVWDHVNTYWPAIEAKERRVTGTAPEKVQASPFTAISAEGDLVEMAGGYYPIAFDPTRSSRAESDTLAEAVRSSMQGLYTRATTSRGHTKARVDEVNGRPVRKDMGVLFEHVEKITHDLSWHEWLIDANRLMRAAPIDAAVRAHYGPAVLRTMKDHLEAIAAGDVPAQSGYEKSVNFLRTGSTIAGLGWNLVTSLLQPFGLTQSIVRIGPKWVAKGLAGWIGDAARMENTVAAIGLKSDFMRLRAKTMQREIAEIRNRVTGDGPVRSAINESFFYFITKMQLVADVPTWTGMYEKAIAHGTDEANAVAQADQAVIDSQGGGQTKDLAAIQRGGPMQKLWLNFYSFFSVLHNLSAESIAKTDFKSPASVGVLAADFLLLFVIPQAMQSTLKGAIKGDLDDPDKLAKRLLADQASYMMSTMVGLREFNAVAGAALGLPSSYSGPAGARIVGESIRLAQQAGQGEADAAFWRSLNSVGGVLFHYPAVQIQRMAEGGIAVAEGKAGPQAILLGPPKQ